MGMVVKFMDQDVTSRVSGYGETEEVKEVLLAKSTLASSEYRLDLRNDDGIFSPYTNNALVRGRRYYGRPLQVTWDGISIFNGYARNLIPSAEKSTVSLIAQSRISDAATRPLSGSATGANPVEAALGWLVDAGLAPITNIPSFAMAAGQALRAGATVDYDFPAESNTTILHGLDLVSDLSSVSFFEHNGLITARAFYPYAGNESGLKWEISTSNCRSFGDLEGQPTNYYNSVTSPWGASGTFTQVDQTSAKIFNGGKEVGRSLGDGSLKAHDLVSVGFFCSQFLLRSSTPRTVMPVAVGADFLNVSLGDRFPVTYSKYGFTRRPFEVIRARRLRDKREIELYLASLSVL